MKQQQDAAFILEYQVPQVCDCWVSSVELIWMEKDRKQCKIMLQKWF